MRAKATIDDVPAVRDAAAASEQPDQVTGPLYGVPIDEVRAWLESQASNEPLPTPKAVQIR